MCRFISRGEAWLSAFRFEARNIIVCKSASGMLSHFSEAPDLRSNRPMRQGLTAVYAPRQGQFLAFIYYYTKLHGRPPAESDMQQYFRVTAPSIHQMVITLEKRGLIARVPRQARSIRLLLPPEELPDLD